MELIDSPGKPFRELTEEEWELLEEEMLNRILQVQAETLTLLILRAKGRSRPLKVVP